MEKEGRGDFVEITEKHNRYSPVNNLSGHLPRVKINFDKIKLLHRQLPLTHPISNRVDFHKVQKKKKKPPPPSLVSYKGDQLLRSPTELLITSFENRLNTNGSLGGGGGGW